MCDLSNGAEDPVAELPIIARAQRKIEGPLARCAAAFPGRWPVGGAIAESRRKRVGAGGHAHGVAERSVAIGVKEHALAGSTRPLRIAHRAADIGAAPFA